MKEHSENETALRSEASELEAKNNQLEQKIQSLLKEQRKSEAALRSKKGERKERIFDLLKKGTRQVERMYRQSHDAALRKEEKAVDNKLTTEKSTSYNGMHCIY